jgi:hypothetical protein
MSSQPPVTIAPPPASPAMPPACPRRPEVCRPSASSAGCEIRRRTTCDPPASSVGCDICRRDAGVGAGALTVAMGHHRASSGVSAAHATSSRREVRPGHHHASLGELTPAGLGLELRCKVRPCETRERWKGDGGDGIEKWERSGSVPRILRERSGSVPRILRDGANPHLGVYSPWSHSAPHPNNHESGLAPLRSRRSPTKHTVRVGDFRVQIAKVRDCKDLLL